MFPRLARQITDEEQVAEKKFLVRSLKLAVDRNKCVNCGVCYYACPNDVIKPVSPFHTTAIALDPDKCSYCGVCQYMCPFDALQLYIDGEAIPNEELQLVKMKVLPELDYEEVVCENNDDNIAKNYMDGFLEYDEKTCLTGCRTCVETCPVKAIYFRKGKSWEREEMLQLDRDKCIACGACAFVCPVNAISLRRDAVKVKGEYNKEFWTNIEKKLIEFKLPKKNEIEKCE